MRTYDYGLAANATVSWGGREHQLLRVTICETDRADERVGQPVPVVLEVSCAIANREAATRLHDFIEARRARPPKQTRRRRKASCIFARNVARVAELRGHHDLGRLGFRGYVAQRVFRCVENDGSCGGFVRTRYAQNLTGWTTRLDGAGTILEVTIPCALLPVCDRCGGWYLDGSERDEAVERRAQAALRRATRC